MSRRAFLKAGGLTGAALVIGIRRDGTLLAAPATAGPFRPSKWLSIDARGRATLTLAGSEMGQGIRTSLPMILADELEVAWVDVALVPARLGPEFKGLGTGGSDSVSSSWMELRLAGAAAREMLAAAAAESWRVPVAECRAEQGAIVHTPSGRRLGYGTLVASAARQPVPKRPRLKEKSEFRLIGQRVKRFDGPAIVDGSARYGLDTRVPGMRVAAVLRCPVLGGRALRWDERRARAVSGVRSVVAISSGVAVVADDTWSAFQGREALDVTWDEGPNRAFDSAAFRERLKSEVEQPGYPSRNDGDARAALERGARRLDAVYEYPFHAHATLEPMNCVAHVHDGRCEIVAPTQHLGRAQARVAERLGLAPEAVSVDVTLLGGGFGRRLAVDYAVEAAEISQAFGGAVQVVWTRADDMRHGHFHPASAHRMAAALDTAGPPIAWLHRKAGSLLSLYPPTENDLRDPAYLRDSSWGAYDIPYAIPNVLTEYRYVPSPVTSGPWRSVYSPPCTFARESFLDELAQAAGRDPLAYRLELLAGERQLKVGMLAIDRERYRRVLERAAREAGWDRPLPGGDGRRWGRGIAGNVYAGQTHVAQVAQVSVGKGGDVRVHRVVCAIDAGLAVNPLGLEAQVESGILFGLSAAIRGEITWRDGRVQQSSYRDYPVMRMRDAPAVEVHILEGASEPYGMGEPPVPPVAPAVINAVFAATGRRIRRLPLRAEELA